MLWQYFHTQTLLHNSHILAAVLFKVSFYFTPKNCLLKCIYWCNDLVLYFTCIHYLPISRNFKRFGYKCLMKLSRKTLNINEYKSFGEQFVILPSINFFRCTQYQIMNKMHIYYLLCHYNKYKQDKMYKHLIVLKNYRTSVNQIRTQLWHWKACRQ